MQPSATHRAGAAAVRSTLIGLACLAGWNGSAALAAVTNATGQIEASVRQINAVSGKILEEAFESTPGTTNILPATVMATIDVLDASEDVQGLLIAIGALNVPGLTPPEQTEDFAMEASGLCLLSDRGFESRTRAVEQRDVVFDAAELGLESGTLVRARSQFALSAGVLLLNLSGGAGDVAGQIEFSVRQVAGGSSQEVLAGALNVDLDANGSPRVQASGQLANATLVTRDLSSAMSGMGQAQLVLIPVVLIPYEYTTRVGEAFSLEAEVVANVSAPTGEQGGSAFMGLLPSTFTATVDSLLNVDLSDDVIAAVIPSVPSAAGLAMASTQIEVVEESEGCGGFGLEMLLGGLALTAGFVSRRVRHPRPPTD